METKYPSHSFGTFNAGEGVFLKLRGTDSFKMYSNEKNQLCLELTPGGVLSIYASDIDDIPIMEVSEEKVVIKNPTFIENLPRAGMEEVYPLVIAPDGQLRRSLVPA
jgi:hypothetical protein